MRAAVRDYFTANPEAAARLRQIEVVIAGQRLQFETAAATFSPEHLDTGTRVLLDHLADAPREGNLLDIGCGWGPIAVALALHAPDATVWAIDTNRRALDLTAANARRLGANNVRVSLPEDVPAGIEFSGIWSNPPIRVGKAALHEILRAWLPRLSEGAAANLVVAKNLGADTLLTWLQGEFAGRLESARVDSDKGFRVLRATRV